MNKSSGGAKPGKDEEEDSADFSNLLSRFGFSVKDISKIKLGSGIIGKIAPMTTYVSLGLISFGLICIAKGIP